jgi:transcriptional regulator with XRE-family HTH domain
MKRKKDDEKRNKDRPQKSIDEKNMSEAELATRLGWSKQYLNRISCGRANPTVEQLERIAESLGMTLHISFE